MLYVDAGLSGARRDRPAYRRLLADAADGRFEVLYVWAFDRLGRDAEELLRARRLLESFGVRLVSLLEGEAESVLTYGLRALIAEEERERIGQRTRLALQRRAQQGHYHGGRAPYGYRRSGDRGEQGTLVAVPAEAAVVRQIVASFIAGAGAAKIATLLNRERLPAPEVSWWSANQVTAMLDNPTYCGRIRLGDQVFQGRHEPLVSETLFEQTARLRTLRRERHGSQVGRYPSGRHLLIDGLLRCGFCGAAMSPRRLHTRRGREIYRCSRRTRYGPAAACPMPTIERSRVDLPVLRHFLGTGVDSSRAPTGASCASGATTKTAASTPSTGIHTDTNSNETANKHFDCSRRYQPPALHPRTSKTNWNSDSKRSWPSPPAPPTAAATSRPPGPLFSPASPTSKSASTAAPGHNYSSTVAATTLSPSPSANPSTASPRRKHPASDSPTSRPESFTPPTERPRRPAA